MNKASIPWVEKYRPDNFDDIVLDPINKKIMKNILANDYFPNLLFYGPPGTGKTTTVINLVNNYLKKNAFSIKGLMIHLNASDERGIDIMRVQIHQFVNSAPLFNNGTKFVILDEVDYMTKNAQQALKYLLQSYNDNIRFCLICNYISRIDNSLQNEFVRLRFNQLPEEDIVRFLLKINTKEELNYSKKTLLSLQAKYKSDIRSMINYMQSNYENCINTRVIDNKSWDTLTELLISDNSKCEEYLIWLTQHYCLDSTSVIKEYLNYIIRYKTKYVSKDFLNFAEFIIHLHEPNIEYYRQYFILCLHDLFRSCK